MSFIEYDPPASAFDEPRLSLAPQDHGPAVRGVALGLAMALAGFIAFEAHSIWRELNALRRERAGVRRSAVVGYENIHLNPTYARPPADWFHHEGDVTLLWAGWRPGQGHVWFRLPKGHLESHQIGSPMGRDVVQAIDWPIVEVGGGNRWERIPWDAPVAGVVIEGTAVAYPMLLLRKVEVVNDTVGQVPLLVVSTPFLPDSKAVNVYRPLVDGRRVTLGSSGYFQRGRPLLYDRGTESLWAEREEAICAIAGPLKGKSLPRLVHLDIAPWSAWRDEHPDSRLLVGADRSRGRPEQ